jgi:predicted transcriptional regulator
MISDDDIRRAYFENIERVKSLNISWHQKVILLTVNKEQGVTSSTLSEIMQIPVESTSTKLKRLYEKGYLSRAEVVSDSGGIEYIYKCRFMSANGGD